MYLRVAFCFGQYACEVLLYKYIYIYIFIKILYNLSLIKIPRIITDDELNKFVG